MIHKIIKFETFNITGRGTVFALNMDDNNIDNINKGDTLITPDEKTWEVSGIETMRTTTINPNIGILVKEIKTQDNDTI